MVPDEIVRARLVQVEQVGTEFILFDAADRWFHKYDFYNGMWWTGQYPSGTIGDIDD